MANNKSDLVSSFTIIFAAETGVIDGVCIKYAMNDRSVRLSYFNKRWFLALHKRFEYYSGAIFYGSDMQRAARDPAFSIQLHPRHPIRTMQSEKPSFTDLDYEFAKANFTVSGLRVIDLEDGCQVDCSYRNGIQRTEVLPSYISEQLRGYLMACYAVLGLAASQPGGTA